MQTLRGRGAPQPGQALALWEARSERLDPGEVNHRYVSIDIGRLADRHFTTFRSHLGSDLEGRALYLALIDVIRLVNQVVPCETVWKEHENQF